MPDILQIPVTTEDEHYCKIIFPLEQDESGWPPHDAETLWAERQPDGSFKLDNIPVFVRGVSCYDIIAADQDEPPEGEAGFWYRFRRVVEPSGHGTVRIWAKDADSVPGLRENLRGFGCDSEGTHLPRLIAVDIPVSADVEAVMEFIAAGEERGDWEYEEGCLPQSRED
jgi:hypothetical protein